MPEWKPHHRKLIKMKRQRMMSQMKGQDKTPEKSSKWSKPSRKRIQNKDGEDDWGSWKNNEDARNVYQRSRGTKEQTEMNNTLEEINSRITEAEEWIHDLKNRMLEITAAKQNIYKNKNGKKKKRTQPKRPLDSVKHHNLHYRGPRRRRERERTWENIWRDNS